MYQVDRNVWEPGRTANGLYEFKLKKNNLKVLLYPMPTGKQVVSINVTYNVGSAMEKQGETGYCHLLEHANFKHANVWKHQAVGATINATTRGDITNYYATLPISDMRAYLRCEANRMIEPHFTQIDLDKEQAVVHNEYERGENSCFQALYKSTIATSMVSHPYHHSTIGYSKDIRRVTEASLKSFFHRFYVPNNAALTITGDFLVGNALDHIASEFTRVPTSLNPVPGRNFFEIKQEGMKQVMLHRDDKASLVQMAFHAPPAHNSDSLALEVISKIVSNGDMGRGNVLSEKGPFFEVGMMTQRMRDTYPVVLVGQLKTAEQEGGIAMMYGLLNQMKAKPVEEQELQAAKTALLREYDVSGLSSSGMMNAVNDALQRRWDAFDMFDRVHVVENLSVQDIQRAANNVFNEDCLTIGRYLPRGGDVPTLQEAPGVTVGSSYDATPCSFSTSEEHGDISYTNLTKTWTLGSGALRLNQLPSARDQKTRFIVSALMDPKTHNFSTVAAVVAPMFLEGAHLNGTEVTGEQLKMFMNKQNIEMNVEQGLNSINFTVSCNKKDTAAALKLTASIIKSPTFPAARLPVVQSRVVAETQGRRANVDKSAAAYLMQSMYPKTHPRYVQPMETHVGAIQNVSYGDLVDFHKTLLSSAFRVTAMSNDDMIEPCKHMVPSNVLVPTTASVHEMPNAKLQTFHIAGKTSAALQMGIPINISRRDNDFMPLRLAAMVLGNGFTGRLMQKVRDEAGLTYGIYADVIGGNPGMAYGSIFKLQSSFNPKVFYEGKDMAMGIVRDWAKNGVTAEELEKQRGFWLGHRSVNLDEPKSEIQMLHCDTCDNVELKDMDLFESRLNKITLKQVNAALRKYIQLDKLHVVEVGTLNPKQ